MGLEALGIPFVVSFTGFYPGLAITALVGLCSLATNLLYLEANLAMVSSDTPSGSNLLSMISYYLGMERLRWLIGILFMVLFEYPLLSYYLSMLYEIIMSSLGGFHFALAEPFSKWIISLIIAFLLGIPIFLGVDTAVRFNGLLMIGLAATFLYFINRGWDYLDTARLNRMSWEFSFLAIPRLYNALGIQVLIPTLSDYLNHRIKPLVWTLIIGSLIPVVIFIALEWYVIGLLPENFLWPAFEKSDPLTRGFKMLSTIKWLAPSLFIFSFFLLTSAIISNTVMLVDFCADGFRIPLAERKGVKRFYMLALTLLPCVLFAPFTAIDLIDTLSYLFGFGWLILSLLPIFMVWVVRNRLKTPIPQLLPGNGISLTILFLLLFYFIWIQGLSLLN